MKKIVSIISKLKGRVSSFWPFESKKIFISYISSDVKKARLIYQVLVDQGHSVFFDEESIKAGYHFNPQIQTKILEADLVIFLVSPELANSNSYWRTELKIVKDKWPRHEGHVLPVMVRETKIEDLPTDLQTIDILRPKGNVAAEVGVEVHEKFLNWNSQPKNLIPSNVRQFCLPIVVMGIAFSALSSFFLVTKEGFSGLLAIRDPMIFSHSSNGLYDIARVIANESILINETKFSEIIEDTNYTFDLLTTSGAVLQDYQLFIESAVRRGVNVRVILQDPGSHTEVFYELLYGVTDEKGAYKMRGEAIRTNQMVQKLINTAKMDRASYKGTIEIRWLDKPMVKTFWLSDAMENNAILHISVPSFIKGHYNSSFRMSGASSSMIIEQYISEFNTLWHDKANPKHSVIRQISDG